MEVSTTPSASSALDDAMCNNTTPHVRSAEDNTGVSHPSPKSYNKMAQNYIKPTQGNDEGRGTALQPLERVDQAVGSLNKLADSASGMLAGLFSSLAPPNALRSDPPPPVSAPQADGSTPAPPAEPLPTPPPPPPDHSGVYSQFDPVMRQ